MLTAGTVLDGRYQILDLIAAGGMGEVYRAQRVLLGDEVAIKVIVARTEDTEVLRERFLRESRACAQLRHPHIVSILDFDVDGEGRPFLVMEYLNGPSLRRDLATQGRLDLTKVRTILNGLAAALQLAHERGIVHRDLKPANVVSHRYETGETVYKLIDFGIANLRPSEATELTSQRQFLGTVAYASPEQLRGEPVDSRSDIYSLGAVVFELLTGRRPFDHEDPIALAMQHLSNAPPAASGIQRDLPAWVDNVLARALAKRPSDRWRTAGEFARALENVQDAEDVTSQSAAPLARATSTVLGNYELRERLGGGRFGSDVFAAVHRAMGHPVAVRTLCRAGRQNWEVARARFLQEAKALQLSHPSVMQVRDFGEEGDLVYIVTELYEGRSLRQSLVEQGFLPWPRLARLSGQLLSAAIAIHRRGGLLCGATPEIIRLTQDDDGERLIVSVGGVSQIQDVTAMLRESTLRGAERPEPELYYVAPELLMGQVPDVQGDVFTLGAIIYEMATGRRPYEAASLPTLLGAMMRTTPPDPRTVQADLPEAACSVILAALSADRDARPRSAADLLNVFDAARD